MSDSTQQATAATVNEPAVTRWNDAGRAELLARAEQLLLRPGRAMLGITGAPGAGKSTLAQWLLRSIESTHPGEAALLPMDGFHLAQAVIDARGLAGRKGSPETFDGEGFLVALRRARDETAGSVFVPEFRREIEEPVAAAIEIPSSARRVIAEGNYLLLEAAPWREVAALLDESWFVRLDPAERVRRLTARHMEFGNDVATAKTRLQHNDEPNALLIADGCRRSSVVIEAD